MTKRDYPELKDDMMNCINQRDINKNLEGFRSDLQGKKLFKDNIESLQRFGKPQDLYDGLVMFKDKGINALSTHSESTCTRNVLDDIKKDLLNIRKGLDVELVSSRCRDKSEYLTAIAKDEQIMKYAERAVTKRDYPELKDDMMNCINQRDINKNLEGFRSDLQGKKLFKDNIESLQRFGKPQDLYDGLVMFKDKGINSFSRHTNTVL